MLVVSRVLSSGQMPELFVWSSTARRLRDAETDDEYDRVGSVCRDGVRIGVYRRYCLVVCALLIQF